MSALVSLIANSVLEVSPVSSFIYGRSFDSALQSSILSTEVAYVFLDPVIKNGTVFSSTSTYNISIGFIKQDAPDSSEVEREVIVDEMEALCISFLTNLFENNVTINGDVIMLDSYTITPIYRIKNVCSGVLCTFTLTFSQNIC